MLVAAFAGFFAAAYSGSLIVGVLAGIGSGLILGGFLAWTTVKWRMDQIIAGVVLNIVATGITSFYYKPGKLLPGPDAELRRAGAVDDPAHRRGLLHRHEHLRDARHPRGAGRALRALPHPVGPAHPLGRRVPVGGRHRRHQRRAAAADQRHPGGVARRLRRRLPVDGRLVVLRAGHGRRPRLPRAGHHDHGRLAAAAGLRHGDLLRVHRRRGLAAAAERQHRRPAAAHRHPAVRRDDHRPGDRRRPGESAGAVGQPYIKGDQ